MPCKFSLHLLVLGLLTFAATNDATCDAFGSTSSDRTMSAAVPTSQSAAFKTEVESISSSATSLHARTSSRNSSRSRHGQPPLHLIVDFDGTCTQSDTTPLLPYLASLHSNDTPIQRQERMDTFRKLEQEYFDDYVKVREEVLFDRSGIGTNMDGGDDAEINDDTDTSATTSSKRIYDANNPHHLHDALRALDDVSTRVTHQVSASSCLSGLPSCTQRISTLLSQSDELRGKAALQTNCLEVLCRARMEYGWRVSVLSINWCPALIGAVLVEPMRRRLAMMSTAVEGNNDEDDEKNGSKEETKIWSNSITDGGLVQLPIPGASEKREVISSAKRNHNEHNERRNEVDDLRQSSSTEEACVVYIGDSSTDLSGLMEADLGIMVGESSTVSGIAEKWGVRIRHISERFDGTMAARTGKNGSCEVLEDNPLALSTGDQSCLKNGRLHERDVDTVWAVDGWEDIDEVLKQLSGHQ